MWAIAIKRQLGKIQFGGSPAGAIDANGFHGAPILPADAETAGALNWAHSDPFDRMLVVQARRLAATLVTADAAIRNYFDGPLLRGG